MLTDEPYCDGSSLARSTSDVAWMLTLPFGDQIEDKMIVSELNRSSSNKKANGTPMKTLIAQEMSKEVESKHSPPNLVAKLMGLDALPQQQPNSAAEKAHPRGYSRRSLSHSRSLAEWDQVNEFRNERMHSQVHQCLEQNEYKDVYEIWQHSQKTNYGRHHSPQKGRRIDNINEKKMALVRRKFTEAKRLATDEKLRQSKEFQEALEVLSSNRDIFLKFLQEPNSLFSQNLYDLQSTPPPPERKRITVLKPSKGVENDKFAGSRKKNDTQAKKPALEGQATGFQKSPAHSLISTNKKVGEYPAQPTRIVVLKPSPGKNHDLKAVLSTPSLSPGVLHGKKIYDASEVEESQESRELAKEITLQMRENMMGHRTDENLLSSVFSNGYVGDDSSFSKSENEYIVENLSDSEVMSPTSQHSWDYINRFGSPYSFSSFSRASCSPESSVCREAKKRLSERWAMMALNGGLQEQRHARRSSSTLGEMLALSDAQKTARSEEVVGEEQKPRGATSGLTSNLSKEEGLSDSPEGLLRSKSLPGSSTIYGARHTIEVPDIEPDKTYVPKELTKAKSTKSSFKGKFSSFLFSRTKKSGKETLGHSHFSDESQSASPVTLRSPTDLPGKISNDMPLSVNSSSHDGCLSPNLHGSASKTSSALIGMGQNGSVIYLEEGFSVAKPTMYGCVSENQDQPSPISVLEPPFEEDDPTNQKSSQNMKADRRGLGPPHMSNLIDKSPPIESIARTLSWDDSCVNTASPYLSKPSLVSRGTEEEEEDWHSFVETLLSGASPNVEVQSDTFLGRWHAPESPLDPSLRDKYTDLNDKEPVHESKRRQRRSIRKLVFDRVNTALVEITGYGPESMVHGRLVEGSSPIVVEQVWDLMKEWFSSEVSCFVGDCGDINSLVVESVVSNEVVGKGWTEHLMLELNNIGKDIEGKLLEELVEEAVLDLTEIV
ncbi:hypothetical protein HS088_TW08G00707 [Tripterygium wilfordii]|uniref:Uncharacterized protein n=1 Tax=Tripterygium wilfordii TaxID=458696 RepID=A0A7J7DCT7_TRIWF|nr:uncharacterized protein LOC120003517 [Tripterygium wilfordii]XP_038708458.1 uncharacterized protein LOC120003517 [Tripterygium wilfordii]XP_038708459.1 uncharacterized protein LOC120003517 [Tripterygium wilfordii]XP_038708460.1 uncharacterized protein LOC120003517 [Tripterygium wilfordii]XP_038708461.1 uncharacterized protein LOC120003517 [Tripterygium wilfordii]XP_038708462.1 uncharacterized protein LOC120003517 [Tripterygium wilfordii]KAF5744114.1 hypothetical protein HS088_TW08G00707 [T